MNAKIYKGLSFEALVGIALKESCISNGWRYLSDVRLSSLSERGYTQIDFIVFTPHKYYCIETKDWNCRVTCSNTHYWSADYGYTVKTLNPVLQNANHLTKIQRRILPSRVEAIVCFSDETHLINKPKTVMNLTEMLMFLEHQNKERLISPYDIDRDYDLLATESINLKIQDIDLSKL